MITLNIPTKIETEADLKAIELEVERARGLLKNQQPIPGQLWRYSTGSIWAIKETDPGRTYMICVQNNPSNSASKVGELFSLDTKDLNSKTSWQRVTIETVKYPS